jgi:DNA-binding beta-propeller fold protein YncE
VRRRTVRQLVPGQEGAVAVGLLYDAATKRIWVAGGNTGTVTAYDSRTGELLFSADVDTDTDPTDNPFLNDVAITRDAVYVTDSTRGRLVVIPLRRGAGLPAPGTFTTLPLTGD